MSEEPLVIEISKGQEHTELMFRRIPAGRFRMGQRGLNVAEEPVHWVHITRDFWMMEMPVTQSQYAIWKPNHRNQFHGELQNPAESMTWHDAVGFSKFIQKWVAKGWLSCLPTEAEWEYACRAGTTTQYHCGDSEEALKEVAWFDEDLSKGSTHPVKSKGKDSANAFGLYDMHGNVWEWCHDLFVWASYQTRVEGIADPGFQEREAEYSQAGKAKEATENLLRVLRGGSWGSSARFCRAAYRFGNEAVDGNWVYGFRLVLVPGPQSGQVGERSSGAGGQSRSRGTSEGGARRRSGR